MAHRELVMAVWEEETGICIPGISLCSLWCLHPAWANTDVDGHSVRLLWQRGGPGEASLDTPPEGSME